MFKRAFTSALVFGLAAMAPPANAQQQPVCQDRDDLVMTLESRYQEMLHGAGMQTPQQLLEIWNSDESGSFTIIITRPDGKSCIVATGRNWHAFEEMRMPGVAG